MTSKRRRSDEQRLSNTRTIDLDLDDFPTWVGAASDEELIKIFKIGVVVKESVELNVTFKQKEIDDLLTEKFKPMSTTIETFATDLSKESKTEWQNIGQKVESLKQSVVNEIHGVVEKVPPLESINSKIAENVEKIVSSQVATVTQVLQSNVMESLKRCEAKLDAINTMYNKPSKKGIAGENAVMELLRQDLKSHTKEDVSKEKNMKGDILIHVTSPQGYKYLIEVNNYQKAVPAKEIEKFENDVKGSPEINVGIMLSLHSGIARRASVGRRFQVTYVNKQYLVIYVPTMMKDDHLAVWSVLLADELAAMTPENDLNKAKLNAMTELFKEFTDCMDKSKKCKDNLEALKKVTTSLEENLIPILQVIDKAKAKLNAILHK